MLGHRHRLRFFGERFTGAAPLQLSDLDPALADELRTSLAAAGEPPLAQAAAKLTIVESCRCDDPACASFYAVDRFHAAWYWGRHGRTIPLRPGLSIDAVGERIIAVEVHGRPTLRYALERDQTADTQPAPDSTQHEKRRRWQGRH